MAIYASEGRSPTRRLRSCESSSPRFFTLSRHSHAQLPFTKWDYSHRGQRLISPLTRGLGGRWISRRSPRRRTSGGRRRRRTIRCTIASHTNCLASESSCAVRRVVTRRGPPAGRAACCAALPRVPQLPYGPAVPAHRRRVSQVLPCYSSGEACGVQPTRCSQTTAPDARRGVFLQCLYNEFRDSLPPHFYSEVSRLRLGQELQRDVNPARRASFD